MRFALLQALAHSRAPLALMLIFLLPRAMVLLVPVEPTSDAAWYFARAVGLAQGRGYVEGDVPTAYWPPGWPLALGALFRVVGPSMFAVKAFNLACAVLTAWLTLDLGRRIFGSELGARCALLLLAVYPNSIGYVPLALTEVFYTALLLGGLWVLVAVSGIRSRIAAGLIFGLASLVKAQSIIVVPLVVAVAWMRRGGGWRALWQESLSGVAVIAVAAAIVAPWTWRNYQVFGQLVPISTNAGLTLLTGNNPSARGDYTDSDPLVTSLHHTVANQLEVDREAKQRALRWIEENTGRFVVLMPLKLFRLWAPDGESEWAFQSGFAPYQEYRWLFRSLRIANQAYYLLLMIGFGIAAALLLTGRARVSEARYGWWLLPYGVALFPSMIAIVFSGQSRFHYPVMPFVAMTCGWLIVYVLQGGDQISSKGLSRPLA